MPVEPTRKRGVPFQRSPETILPRCPNSCDGQGFGEWCESERKEKPLAVDLFSGAGGLSRGIEKAGWTVVAAVDHDKRSLETHAANFRGLALNVDMFDGDAVQTLISQLKPLDIDLVAGGPPCQPFSRAGSAKIRSLVAEQRRQGHDPRRDLWRSYLRVVLALMPRVVLMENVPDIAKADGGDILRQLSGSLEKVGYEVEYRVLEAWRYGVPQPRKRMFLQARRDGFRPQWPRESSKSATVKDAIFDLPRLGDSTGGVELPYDADRSRMSSLSLSLWRYSSGCHL